MSEKRSWARRKLIIYPKLQIALVGWMAAGSLMGALFTASYIVYTTKNPEEVPPYAQPLFLGAGLLIFSAYAVLILYYTNRIFGPIYRVHMTVKAMNEGTDNRPIRLRNGDHFHELVNDLNQITERSQKK